MSLPRFRKKEFLRARHPEQFSDSVVEDVVVLDPKVLEYHLSTLTNRSQELDFQRFARRLAERTICPNLLPQTGPTGGGDSKVDTETYPVADSIALFWFEGIGREAASERWAFGISAKADWKAKVRSDVAKIAGTDRDYRKVFFISSQFIADKARAAMEDELRVKHGLDVRILDRSWIVEKVFDARAQELVLEELKVGSRRASLPRQGPLDQTRQIELEATEERIKEELAKDAGPFRPGLVDSALNAALLSRGLERPRVETDGRFDRADELARRFGTKHQQILCVYNRAWTAHWWHEDSAELLRLYPTIEGLVHGTSNFYQLEMLANLWMICHGLVAEGFSLDELSLPPKTDLLQRELERLSAGQELTSTGLQAKVQLLQVSLFLSAANRQSSESLFEELLKTVHLAEDFVGFPMSTVVKCVTELGEYFGDAPAYERLFEALVDISGRRESEAKAARLLVNRGRQHLNAERPYEAIKVLGRALSPLFKHESRHDAINAMHVIASAYWRVGLLWAARGTLLSAASLAVSDLDKYGHFTRSQASCCRMMKWIELSLGRFPQLLEWHAANQAFNKALSEKGLLTTDGTEFDAALAVMILGIELQDLPDFGSLPDVLERCGLAGGASALLLALGHDGRAHEVVDEPASEDLAGLFQKLRAEPALSSIPRRPAASEGRKVSLASTILGCTVTVEASNESPCLELAESFLAALESFAATGLIQKMMAREPNLLVEVRKSDFATPPFEFSVDFIKRPRVSIMCAPFNASSMAHDDQDLLKQKLFEVIVRTFAELVMIDGPREAIVKMLRDERAHDRSISFTGSFVTSANVLGPNQRTQVADWRVPGAKQYALLRSAPWDADNASEPGASAGSGTGSIRQIVDPVTGKFNTERLKHSDIEISSLIRERLWNDAGWTGMLFATTEIGPPIMALYFRNPAPAKDIFWDWKERMGNEDSRELLRITVVRGIDERRPFAYRVAVGVNVEIDALKPGKVLTAISRVQTMEPPDDSNLTRFLSSYAEHGLFLLCPATASGSEPQIFHDLYITKRELNVRRAWEIGKDFDAGAILQDDCPVIPEDVKDAPVLKLLRQKPVA